MSFSKVFDLLGEFLKGKCELDSRKSLKKTAGRLKNVRVTISIKWKESRESICVLINDTKFHKHTLIVTNLGSRSGRQKV